MLRTSTSSFKLDNIEIINQQRLAKQNVVIQLHFLIQFIKNILPYIQNAATQPPELQLSLLQLKHNQEFMERIQKLITPPKSEEYLDCLIKKPQTSVSLPTTYYFLPESFSAEKFTKKIDYIIQQIGLSLGVNPNDSTIKLLSEPMDSQKFLGFFENILRESDHLETARIDFEDPTTIIHCAAITKEKLQELYSSLAALPEPEPIPSEQKPNLLDPKYIIAKASEDPDRHQYLPLVPADPAIPVVESLAEHDPIYNAPRNIQTYLLNRKPIPPRRGRKIVGFFSESCLDKIKQAMQEEIPMPSTVAPPSSSTEAPPATSLSSSTIHTSSPSPSPTPSPPPH